MAAARNEAGERQQTLACGAYEERFTVVAGHGVGERGLGRVAFEADEVAGVVELDPVGAERPASVAFLKWLLV